MRLVPVGFVCLLAACTGSSQGAATEPATIAGNPASAGTGAGLIGAAGVAAPVIVTAFAGTSAANPPNAGAGMSAGSGINMAGRGSAAAGREAVAGRAAPTDRGGGGAGSMARAGSTGSAGVASNVAGAGARGGTGAGGAASGSAGRAAPGNGNAVVQCAMPTGAVTYNLSKAAMPTASEQDSYAKITAAMDVAVSYYNCYTNITKRVMVSYDPSVATADGSTSGSIRFGAQSAINHITAMHEIAHTVGVGSSQFGAMISNGIFTGKAATAQLVAITGNAQDQVHGDKQHFWPYGLNYTSEVKSVDDLLDHSKMVVAIRKDLGM
jgi:hypothetical protein